MTDAIWSHHFLQRHHLMGYAYNKSKAKEYYPEWKAQLTRNFLVKLELEKIGEDCAFESLAVCLLKGYSLMGDLYEDWGIRFASDVDLLVSPKEFWRLSDILTNRGYKKVSEKKWLGNKYKYLFQRSVGDSEICIEVHTQLFWHKAIAWQEDMVSAHISGCHKLGQEHQLVHLCGHLGFQHTFLKLFWLIDICKFLERNKETLDWEKFWTVSMDMGLYKSCYCALFLCQKLGLNLQTIFFRAPKKSKLSVTLLKKLLSLRFLNDPRRFPIQYFLVKFLIKDSWMDSSKYTYYWLKNRFKKED